jgi:alkylation response protein AidB-like acyl-CoA dehydrogenase
VDLTAEQRALRDAVRALLAREQRRAAVTPDPGPPAGSAAGPAARSPATTDSAGVASPSPTPPGYDPALWLRLCEIGVAGLGVPERYGGAGADPVETHIVAEELGRHLTPSPLLGSAVLAAQALLASGDQAACQRLLPAVADGSAIAALAWTAAAGRWDPGEVACHAAAAAPGWVVHGEAHHVLDGDAAGILLVAARAPDGIGLFEVDPDQGGVSREPVTTMDTTRRLAVVRLDGAAGRRIGAPGTGDLAAGATQASLARARDLACITLSAEQAGAARQALDLTVAYTKVRVQFGRAIGGFQALAHRMADLHVLVESARSLSYAAAQAAAGQAPDTGLRAAAAKVYCSETLQRVAAEMIQLHGAIGITWEHGAHRYLKRAHGAAQLFGRPGEHAARIAAALIDH